jgi:hypothetical protein
MSTLPSGQPFKDRSRNPFISSTFRHRETKSFFGARWRNVGVGVGLLGFVGCVFLYSISAVAKDDFSGYDKDGIKIRKVEESKVPKN